MSHECEDCGQTFETLSRLRLHDCPETTTETDDPLSSFDSFLDSISDAIEADMQQKTQEREKRGLEAASDSLRTALESAAHGDVDAAFTMLAHYERDLTEYHDREDYDTYRGIFWAFYEPAAASLDELAQREGWSFLGEVIEAYPPETPDSEPHVSPVIENAVARFVIRTRMRDGVGAIPTEALDYLGSFSQSDDTSFEEAFPYGWGIDHPDHSVADHLRNIVTEELFWVRGALRQAFYADQHAAADLLDAFLTTDRIDYEDRYILATVLADVEHTDVSGPPRYWDWMEELDDSFEWDDSVEIRLRDVIETEDFHQRLPADWTFTDLEL